MENQSKNVLYTWPDFLVQEVGTHVCPIPGFHMNYYKALITSYFNTACSIL